MDYKRALTFLIEDFSEVDLREKRLEDVRAELWAFLNARPPGERGVVVGGSVKTAVLRRLTKGQAAALQRAVRPFLRDVLDRQVVPARQLAGLRVSGVQMRGFQFHGTAVLQISGPVSAVFQFQVARLLLQAGDFVVRFGRCEAPKAHRWPVGSTQPFELCGRPFCRTRRTRRFCSATCKARLWAREHQ